MALCSEHMSQVFCDRAICFFEPNNITTLLMDEYSSFSYKLIAATVNINSYTVLWLPTQDDSETGRTC